MYVHYNPNPSGRNVEDCSVRAVAKALNTDWESAYAMLVSNGFLLRDMPHANSVWGDLLKKQGFYRASIPNGCPECYTVTDFAREHPSGTFVLACSHHVLTVDSGNVFDSWDSSSEIPQYFWYKKED